MDAHNANLNCYFNIYHFIILMVNLGHSIHGCMASKTEIEKGVLPWPITVAVLPKRGDLNS